MAYAQPALSESERRRRRANRELLRAVEDHRYAISDGLLDRAVDRSARTLAVDLLAEEFVDVLLASLDGGDWQPLHGWAERVCHRRPESHVVRTLVASALDVAIEVLRASDPRLTSMLGAVDEARLAVERVVRKPRAVRELAAETVDEVDIQIENFVATLDEADPHTAEHSRAVSAWCARIACRMGLTQAQTTFVTRGGLIHDIGKSTTPKEILLAPRKLNEVEWAIMRDHVVAGEQMIAPVKPLRPFAPIVRSHHERFAGGGYPDGRVRHEIPLAVRIVTVADCFNAMIGRRPYRGPFSPTLALEELKRNRGTHFDPVVVDAMLDVVLNSAEPRSLLRR